MMVSPWSLGLSVGPDGFGSAVQHGFGEAHLIGVFPTIARALNAGSLAAPDQPPTRVVFVHTSGMSAAELGRHMGDLALAGLATEDVELRSDAEVLTAVTGNRVLLVDADRNLIAAHPGRNVRFAAATLAELVAEDPFATTVALTGQPEFRDKFHVAARDYAPILVERPALAALALNNPTTSAQVSTPRTAGALSRSSRRALPYLMVAATGVVAMVLMLVVLFG